MSYFSAEPLLMHKQHLPQFLALGIFNKQSLQNEHPRKSSAAKRLSTNKDQVKKLEMRLIIMLKIRVAAPAEAKIFQHFTIGLEGQHVRQ